MNQKRIHSSNDWFLAVILCLLIGMNLLTTYYAHGIISGAQSDIRLLAPQVNSLLSIPSTVVSLIISYILPICVFLWLIIKKRPFIILEGLISVVVSFVTVSALLFLLKKYATVQLLVGYTVLHKSFLELTIPYSFACFASLLVIAGPRSREKLINTLWLIFIMLSLVQIILSLQTLMGALLAIQIGLLCGFACRFALGKENLRVDVEQIVALLTRHNMNVRSGKDGQKVIEAGSASDGRKRFFNAEISSEIGTDAELKAVRIVIFDEDRQVIGIISRLKQFLKFREIALRHTTFEGAFNHIALMNLAARNAGMNYPKLLLQTMVGESMVFVFEDGVAQRFENTQNSEVNKNVLTNNAHRNQEFWRELQLAHTAGLTHNNISPSRLRIYQEHAALWEVDYGSIAPNELFEQIDNVQLLVATTLITGIDDAFTAFLQFHDNNEDLSTTLALLHAVILPRESKRILRELRSDQKTDVLQLLRARIEQYIQATYGNSMQVDLPQFRRFSLRRVMTLGLSVVAIMLLLTQLNFDAIVNSLSTSNHFWALISVFFAGLTILGATFALYGLIRQEFDGLKDFYRLILAQTAAKYLGLQLPQGFGPVALNMRYLSKRSQMPNIGRNTAQNGTISALVQAIQLAPTFILLFIFGIASGSNVGKIYGSSSNASSFLSSQIVIYIVIALFAALLTCVLIPHTRRILADKLLPILLQLKSSVSKVLEDPSGLAISLAGAFGQAFAYILSFWCALNAFGIELSITTTALIFLIGYSAGSFAPVPGGLGITETALTIALGAVLVPPSVAISAILLFRIASFWLPALFGFIALKQCEKRGIL
jgi:uncharacterized protein (TIRG00374 family)